MIISSSTSGVDKLERILFYIASDDTWQGVIMNKWPYSNTPMLVSAVFSTETLIFGNIAKEYLILMNV